MIRVKGCVLAGGKSSRMGRCKAGIRLDGGDTFLDSALSKLAALPVEKPVVSGASGIPDLLPDKGPLGGIHSILWSCQVHGVMFIPCDAPFLRKQVLEKLLRGFMRNASRPAVAMAPNLEPLIAVVPGAWRERVSNCISLGHLKVGRFWLDCGFTPVMVPCRESVRDVDRPGDLSA